MKRRNFLQQLSLTGASILTASAAGAAATASRQQPIPTADKPFNLNYATHDGMFKNSAGADFIDQIKFAYDHGFRSIEDNGMMARTPEQQKKIGDTLQKLGMNMGVFVVTSDNWHWKTSLTTGKTGVDR
jgi:hydroxypyruvate isomerase